jgi:hypothetical protein
MAMTRTLHPVSAKMMMFASSIVISHRKSRNACRITIANLYGQETKHAIDF